MILIITHKTDYTADFLINILNQRSIEYRRFNCEDLLSSNYEIEFGAGFKYSILGCADFQSVWFRRTKLPDLNGLSNSERAYILSETDSLIQNLLSILNVNWISEPTAVYRAENKLLQLKTAMELGFNIPQTLITSSKERLVTFYGEQKSIVVKPFSQTRITDVVNPGFIFTSVVTEKEINSIDDYDLTPCIFQQNVEKDYELRITVVGSKVFPAAVDSQDDIETKVDWRRKKLKFRQTEIPDDLAERCIQLVASLGLQFGAIDLIKTKDNRYVFLEVNPNGQWVWIENETGAKIADAIIETLLK